MIKLLEIRYTIREKEQVVVMKKYKIKWKTD